MENHENELEKYLDRVHFERYKNRTNYIESHLHFKTTRMTQSVRKDSNTTNKSLKDPGAI